MPSNVSKQSKILRAKYNDHISCGKNLLCLGILRFKSKPGFIILLCVFWVDERLLKKMKVNKGFLPRAFEHYKSCLSVERIEDLNRLQ